MMSENEHSKDTEKALRFIDYLLQIASLRATLIRDVADYARVLWLSDIPKREGFYFTQAWGPQEGYDADTWLEVCKEPEPKAPPAPKVCEDWVDEESLSDTETRPTLPSEIELEELEDEDAFDEDGEVHSSVRLLDDCPEVAAAWEAYLANEWEPWKAEQEEWRTRHKVYADLFAIHQEQLRRGEEYELVLGLGLLAWETPSNQRVFRHLVTARATLEFDSQKGIFTVQPHPDGSKLGIELDMLAVEEQPIRTVEAGEQALEAAEGNPWEKLSVEDALKATVHSIDADGIYVDALGRNVAKVSKRPTVIFAPALILRKRSSKSLTDTLLQIRQAIAAGGEIPPKFGDLIEDGNGRSKTTGTRGSGDGDEFARAAELPEEIYFPKPTNAEQRRIVERLQTADGVLVQGPPGTGKSHTIANVICHLLATGQRILITAKTPHALAVLEGHVPEPLRALCINLLGSGSEERKSVEHSVGGILHKHRNWVEVEAFAREEELTNQLERLRSEEAVTLTRLRAIRESENHPQSVANGAYQGTAARIARAVDADRETYGWFGDAVSFDKDCPIDAKSFQSLLEGLKTYSEDRRSELQLWWPESLPAGEELERLVSEERKVDATETGLALERDTILADKLFQSADDSLDALLDALSAFRQSQKRLAGNALPWIPEALREILGGNPTRWKTVAEVTTEAIAVIELSLTQAEENTLERPAGRPLRAVLSDAMAIQGHLDAGGKLGFGPIRPKLVSERKYLLVDVLLNGRKCREHTDFAVLVQVLKVHEALEKVRPYWNGHAGSDDSPLRLQLQCLQANLEVLGHALQLSDEVPKLSSLIENYAAVTPPAWYDANAVNKLVDTVQTAVLRTRKRTIESRIRALQSVLSATNDSKSPHPLVHKLREAIQERDLGAFAEHVAKLDRLETERQRMQQVDNYMRKLGRLAPKLVESLSLTHTETHWQERAQHIVEAWRWAQAKWWLDDYIRSEDVDSLAKKLEQIEDGIRDAIKGLSDVKAWSRCFARLNSEHREHMEAWQQAMRRLGKGTGKYAERHRREARMHLDKCREAVPAWVMPLHRVWDTVTPSAGMFDVIIVDEASQCGIEALPLLYLGTKILVVGDDKQISPEAVGINQESVHTLMERFLYDFEFKGTFSIESSLFDHGRIRFDTSRVSLREHFRSMPEIIRFSNELCYADAPLIPLRQYGPNRLEPLKRVRVSEGYREGKGNRVINRPEAKVVVETIVELCADREYAGKSMGVVVLQGDAQAALIEGMLLEELGAEEMESRRLLCGNPYSFQGDERDIIFLSMVAAGNERIGAFTKAADERRFNVAASRARDQMWLFHSVSREDLGVNCLRRRLLEFFEDTRPKTIAGIDTNELERRAVSDNRGIVKAPAPFDSWFEVDVALEISRAGYTVIPQWEIASKRIDLVVEGGIAQLAVECDGEYHHGLAQAEADSVRQRMLERCGWRFFRVRESAFYANKEFALEGLWRKLEELGIQPGKLNAPERVDGPEHDKQELLNAEMLPETQEEFDEAGATHPAARTQARPNSERSNRRAHEYTPKEIQSSILRVLAECPNKSCTEDSMPKRVLKDISVITRGKPLREFGGRVTRAITTLEKQQLVERYRAKNDRVRLLS